MKVSRPSMVFGSVALTAALACSACSSSPSAPSVATLRQQVLAITASTNARLAKDKSAKNPAQTDAKYALDFHRAAGEFHALKFPTSMRHDADALVTALNTMSTEATAVGLAAAKNQSVEANVSKMAQLNLKLIEEEKVEKTAINTLRNDLGLPPEPTTTRPPPPSQPQPLKSTP